MLLLRRTTLLLRSSSLLLVVALLLAACGGDGSDGSTTDAHDADVVSGEEDAPRADVAEPDTSGAAVADQAEGMLRVELRNVGRKDGAGLPPPTGVACTRSLPATCHETITCPVDDEAGDAAEQRVCAWLRDTGLDLLVEEPEPGVCTQVYGGPEVATVTGRVDGEAVDATFSREDGCAIARFDEVAPLWTGVIDPDVPIDAGGAAAGACAVITDPDTPVPSDDPAAGAADRSCPGGAVATEPRIVDDPPEAFEFEPSSR